MKLFLTLLAELWRSTRGLLAAALVTLSGLLPQISPALPAPPPAVADGSELTVRFLDVGQADAALLSCDGEHMLIDGGNKGDSRLIYRTLEQLGIRWLTLVVGTHAHEDHIGGLPGALSFAEAGQVLCPVTDYDSEAFRDFARLAELKGGGLIVPSVGDEYALGGATVRILGLNAGEDTNDSSILLKVTHGEISFLFTGDAERAAEQAVLDSGAELAATVLKVGHHGSETSTSYPFLRAVMPQVAVISVGEDNSYDHPHEQPLSRLEDAGCRIFRTDHDGTVVCRSDGRELTVETGDGSSLTVGEAGEAAAGEEGSGEPSAPEAAPQSAPAEEGEPPDAPQEEELPPQERFLLNTRTRKFHRMDCAGADAISVANRGEFFGNRADLVALGYEPCGSCKP